MENIASFWQHLPWLIRLPFDYLFSIVLVRGVLGSEINDWLKEKGIFREGILHSLFYLIGHIIPSLAPTIERYMAIWQHFGLQSQGAGHESISVTMCSDGHCTIFKTT